MEDAFSKIVAGLAVDMPLLMHGSGDVPPDHGQNSAAVNLLSSLTAQYIAHLTDAALDSHSMLCDGANSRRTGDSSMKVQRLPPPAFPVSRNPPIPSPPSPLLTQQQSKGQSAVITARGRKRHRARDDFWDLPLPEPKIKKQNDSAIKEKQDDSAGRKNISFGGDEVEIEENVTTPHVHVDEWVGVTGVDFYQGTSRARLAYVRGPTSGALSTQSFVFPICHDVYAYGRVKEVLEAKRAAAGNFLVAPNLTEMIKIEGHNMRIEGRKKNSEANKKKNKTNNNSTPNSDIEDEADADDDADQEEEDTSDDDDDGLAWPGLADLLPVHLSGR